MQQVGNAKILVKHGKYVRSIEVIGMDVYILASTVGNTWRQGTVQLEGNLTPTDNAPAWF